MTEERTERTIRILLVEDNQGDIRLTEEAFKECSLDIELSVVRRGAEALDFLYQRDEYADVTQPDVVLLDWRLPSMSGSDVVEKIEMPSELDVPPIVFLTGSPSEIEQMKPDEKYVRACLTKPIDPDEFVNLVSSIIHVS